MADNKLIQDLLELMRGKTAPFQEEGLPEVNPPEHPLNKIPYDRMMDMAERRARTELPRPDLNELLYKLAYREKHNAPKFRRTRPYGVQNSDMNDALQRALIKEGY